jgi:uncharacterized membrane protein
MSSRFYAVVVFVLMTIAVHLAYILFAPGSRLGDALTEFQSKHGVNNFAVLDAASANKLLKHSPSDMIVAACLFDLSSGPVKVFSKVTGRYWVLSVYSNRGDIIYTLNDRQAASDKVNVTINRQLAGNPDAPAGASGPAAEGIVAQVVSSSPQGLIVVRSGVSLPNEDADLAEELMRSSCQV